MIAPDAPASSDMRRRRVPFPVRALLRFPCGCGWAGAGQKEHVGARPPFVRTDARIGANNFLAGNYLHLLVNPYQEDPPFGLHLHVVEHVCNA